MYDDVETFCMFIGYTRSGHSLVGTILDAHHQAVIAHEGEIYEYASRPRQLTGKLCFSSRDELFQYLVGRSTRQGDKGSRGRRRDEKFPLVPGASNGRFTTLKVIGNKRGQETPVAWDRNPNVLAELEALTGTKVKLLHVYRNPWDNIASMMRSNSAAVGRYFTRVRIIRRFKEAGLFPVHDLALEDLIADPRKEIEALLAFYGLSADEGFYRQCASLIDDEPQASRQEHDWSDAQIKEVQQRMQGVSWLQRYEGTPVA